MAEIDIALDKLAFIVVKARAYDVKEGVVDPDAGSNATDDKSIDVLEDIADDPTAEELKDAIDILNVDEKAELVAITWIGRGDFETTNWDEAVQTARDRHTGATSDYLMGMPLLADYLEEGLDRLGLSIMDAEKSHL